MHVGELENPLRNSFIVQEQLPATDSCSLFFSVPRSLGPLYMYRYYYLPPEMIVDLPPSEEIISEISGYQEVTW